MCLDAHFDPRELHDRNARPVAGTTEYSRRQLGNCTGLLAASSITAADSVDAQAMGAYEYDAPNQPFGPDLSVPACIVEGTRGDRRLGSHVLASLEIIMPTLVDASALDVDALIALFVEPRRNKAGGNTVTLHSAHPARCHSRHSYTARCHSYTAHPACGDYHSPSTPDGVSP